HAKMARIIVRDFARFWRSRGYLGEARRWLATSAEQLRREGDQVELSRCLSALANVCGDQGDLDAARAACEEAIPLARAYDPGVNLVNLLSGLGTVLRKLGDPAGALELLTEAVDRARDLGDITYLCPALVNLANFSAKPDPDRARPLYQEALALARAQGDRRYEAAILANMAGLDSAAGDHAAAIAALSDAARTAQELRDEALESKIQGLLGVEHREIGNPEASVPVMQRCIELAERVGDQVSLSEATGDLGLTILALGDPRQAVVHLEQSLALARKIGHSRLEIGCLGGLSEANGQLGHLHRARACAVEALQLARDSQNEIYVVDMLEELADALLQQGDASGAIRAAACAEARRARGGVSLPPNRLARVEGIQVRARAAVGADAFDQMWTESLDHDALDALIDEFADQDPQELAG
ncbi:MAG TPA: tetratricopeptide repeat protein, partial [Actinomycetota bacterium]|nr:tetratricopeptide repeat protein [Actinomycetota bacterium]